MNPYVELAKKAVESYVEREEIIEIPDDLPKEMIEKKSGTFVTIKKDEDLKGCIGTYLPIKESVAQEIIHNAVAAATEDYRFGPIQKEELPSLSYTVYLLGKPELVKDIKELNPQKYGIIVKTTPIGSPDRTDVVFNGHAVAKSALLLPDLEGIDTTEKQVLIACQKGGINPTREKIIIYRFTVGKHQ